MKIGRVVHYRCSEYDCCSHFVLPDDISEEKFEADAEKARAGHGADAKAAMDLSRHERAPRTLVDIMTLDDKVSIAVSEALPIDAPAATTTMATKR